VESTAASAVALPAWTVVGEAFEHVGKQGLFIFSLQSAARERETILA
jgi:hypothetical protein